MFALPLELYELILLNLSVPELLRVSQVSRAFYQITRWCLVNERYYRHWRVAFNEDGCSRRIIPLDVEETRKQIREGTGFYIFTSNIRPLPLVYEPVERIDLNHRTMNFGMRFLDFRECSPPTFIICFDIRRHSGGLYSYGNNATRAPLRRVYRVQSTPGNSNPHNPFPNINDSPKPSYMEDRAHVKCARISIGEIG